MIGTTIWPLHNENLALFVSVAPFTEMPEAFRALQDLMLRKPPFTVCRQTVAGQRGGDRDLRCLLTAVIS